MGKSVKILETRFAWIVVKGAKRHTTKLSGGMVLDAYKVSMSCSCMFHSPEFIWYEDLFDESKGLLCDGQLEIVCEVHGVTNTNIFVNSWLSEFDPFKPDEHTLVSDLKQHREKSDTSNFTVVSSDGQEFPVHTYILAARSTVFDAMLEQDMKEKREKRVIIDDISPEAVARLLDFMYTDVVPGINANLASELLPAAHKYQLPRLIGLCEEAIMLELIVENAAQILELADVYDAKQLLKRRRLSL